MKKFKLLLLILLTGCLCGCNTIKKSITGDEFLEIISEYEYRTTDVTANYDYALSAYNAQKNDTTIFFLKAKKKYDVEGIFIDEYQNLFTKIDENYTKKLTNGTSWTSLKLISNENLYYLSWVDDSYIIITSLKTNENEVDKIINSLGY